MINIESECIHDLTDALQNEFESEVKAFGVNIQNSEYKLQDFIDSSNRRESINIDDSSYILEDVVYFDIDNIEDLKTFTLIVTYES